MDSSHRSRPVDAALDPVGCHASRSMRQSLSPNRRPVKWLGKDVAGTERSSSVGRLTRKKGETWMFGHPYLVTGIVPHGATVVAINVGGALIPTLLSIYLFLRLRMRWRMLIGTAVVALVANQMAEVVPGVGIVVPALLPPLLAAGVALVLAFRRAPPVAYVAGTMGALIGADLLNLGRVAEMGGPMASIGGAGTFDGVFLTGILAGLLA
jgi:uncharacterized membrane protein